VRGPVAGCLPTLLALGCGSASVSLPDGAAPPDLAIPVEPPDDGGPGAIFAAIAFSGCDAVDSDGGEPRCSGAVPLALTLVPLGPSGVTSWRWSLPGASPSSSKAPTPMVVYSLPGLYPVSLVVGGPAGAASAQAEVRALAGGTGAPCSDERQCGSAALPDGGDVKLGCLCPSATDGGGCPGALADGLCARECVGGGCAAGEICVDLSRSAPGSSGDGSWHHPICLPACATAADCRAGLLCRDLPALAPGEVAGGTYAWQKGCFAGVLGDDGAACAGADGKPRASDCLGGLCALLGARDLCSSPCDGLPCPASAACATFNNDPRHPFCLPRCDAQHPCADPLLACAPASAVGALGYTVAAGEPPGATYCSPKRCTGAADCAPAGTCPSVDGGAFCTP
jgi:hypothetical protein